MSVRTIGEVARGQGTREGHSPRGDNQGGPQNPSPERTGLKIVTDNVE